MISDGSAHAVGGGDPAQDFGGVVIDVEELDTDFVPTEAKALGPDDLPLKVHVGLEHPEPNVQRAFAATLAQYAHAADRQVQDGPQIAG